MYSKNLTLKNVYSYPVRMSFVGTLWEYSMQNCKCAYYRLVLFYDELSSKSNMHDTNAVSEAATKKLFNREVFHFTLPNVLFTETLRNKCAVAIG